METEKLKLSNQALGTLMMSLQKGLMEQIDITEILKDLNFYVSVDNEIVCYNPPVLEYDDDDFDDDEFYDIEDDDEKKLIPLPDFAAEFPWGFDPDENLTPEEGKKADQQYLEGWEDWDPDFSEEEDEYP